MYKPKQQHKRYPHRITKRERAAIDVLYGRPLAMACPSCERPYDLSVIICGYCLIALKPYGVVLRQKREFAAVNERALQTESQDAQSIE